MRSGSIWIHAVSAGEVIAAEPLINLLLDVGPSRLLITTTTPAGSAEVLRRFGSRVDHCYVPFDAHACVRRFLRRAQPRALVLMETELWPNLLRLARQQGVKICLANARLSSRSAKRYGLVSRLAKRMFADIDMIVSQYEDSASRFIALGYPQDRIHVTGNIKFDLQLTDATRAAIARRRAEFVAGRAIWIASSTHVGEEELALDAHIEARQAFPDLLLILAPRHPRRSEAIVELARVRSLRVARLDGYSSEDDVVVVDRMGALLEMYGVADVAFIGGSMQGTGGHNPVEPAVLELPMLMGPDRMNFEAVCQRFSDAGCLTTVRNSSEIAQQLLKLLQAPDERRRQGQAARNVVDQNRGATERQMALLTDWLNQRS